MVPRRYQKSARRTVQLTGRVARRGRNRLWAFGYADLAVLLATTPAAVRQRVKRKDFNPADLTSVCEHWLKHRDSILKKRAAQENSPPASGLTPAAGLP